MATPEGRLAYECDMHTFYKGAPDVVALPETTGGVFHGYLPGVIAGQRYGFRVHGEYHPKRGLRADPTKLLLDPYARAIQGEVHWSEHVFSDRVATKLLKHRHGDSSGVRGAAWLWS